MPHQRPASKNPASSSSPAKGRQVPLEPLERATTTAMDRPQDPLPLLRKAPSPSDSYKTLSSSASSSAPPGIASSAPRSDSDDAEDGVEMDLSNLSRRSQWIVLAVASGACAAFNGVFAKLTTTELTTSFSLAIARLLHLGDDPKVLEFIIRGLFFALNLIFNGIMWALFTKALARGTSTTQVSIINTSSNFMITAVLGFMIFSESLPPLWWCGASLLVAGNVIIGRREEKDVGDQARAGGEGEAMENGVSGYSGSEEGEGLLSEDVELTNELEAALKRTQVVADEDILDLDGSENR